ncbi:MAG: DUF4430 domain-containing protein [Propionicimonas sp.]|nr:DUF4430 domain-containing protein [Propionicimonas sp.]
MGVRLVAMLAGLALVLGIAPATALAADGITVYVTFEGYNLGQGYYVPPTKLTAAQDETAAQAALAALDGAGLEAQASGDPDSAGFFLSGIEGDESAAVHVPSYISGQPGFELTDANNDGYLGVGDYNSMAGWMFTVNNEAAQVGAGAVKLHDGDVVRWQFTLYGYGCDLGVPTGCWGADPYYTTADKSELIRTLLNADPAKATADELTQARQVAVDPTATQAQVTASITALTTVPVVSNYALTAPTGAAVTVLRQVRNYAQEVLEPAAVEDNQDGTTTHRFQVPAANSTYTYRVSKAGKITQSGYVSSLSPVTVAFPDGDPAATGTSGTAADAYDDAGVLLNIGTDGQLRLGAGASFDLRAFRAPWQIVNNTISNYMIEPDFHYTVLSGSDVVSITPDPKIPGWATLTALSSGEAVVRVTFDVIGVGAGRYGATNPVRAGVFAVTVGDDQDTSLKITVPKPGGAAWDSEFDTWYFTGAKAVGAVEVSGSPTTVTAWNPAVPGTQTLTGDGETYPLKLYPGTNIVKAVKGAAVSYKVIRAAAVTPEITNVTSPGVDPAPGDQVKIHLKGVFLPVPKMSGIYNPEFSGAKAVYSAAASTVTGTSGQYTFSSVNSLTVTIPEDASDGFALTGGYIKQSHFGSAIGEHRKITRDGVPPNLNAPTGDGNYGVLPNLTLLGSVTPPAEADKSALETAITTAQAASQPGHTAASWSAFQAALTTAQAVAADPAAEQEQVDTATTALTEAFAGLAMKGEAPPAPSVPASVTKAQQAAAAWMAAQLADNKNVLSYSGSTDWGLTMDALFALAGAKVGGKQITATAHALYASGESYIGPQNQLASRWPYVAKTALALEIAGIDPTAFPVGGSTRDLIADLRSSIRPDGRWTNSADAFKTSLGILALSRTEQGVPASAVTAYQAMACLDTSNANFGSFGYLSGCSGADVDTTAMAVQALLAAGVSASDPSVSNAVAWLGKQQDKDGSFPSPWGPGNTNSGGLAGQALFGAGKTSEALASAAFVQSLQLSCMTAADEKVTDAAVVKSLKAATGAIAYNADGWSEALEYGLDATNIDQWRRATAQAILGLGSPTLGFVSAAGVSPSTPSVVCPAPVPQVPQSAVKAVVTVPVAGDTITPGTVLGSGSVASGYQTGYQWLRDGQPIAKATGKTYTVVAADQGHKLSVRVTVSKTGYTSRTVTSAAVSVPKSTVAFTATFSGSLKAGKTLKSATAPKGVKFSYQWLRDGKKVVGKKSSYTLVAADAGHAIQLRITATGSKATKTVKTTAAKLVAKLTPKVSVKLAKSTVKPTSRAVVKITVSVKGLKPGGKVQVTYGSKKVSDTVKKGKATVKLPKLKKGSYKLKVKYLGSTELKAKSAKTVTLKVK